MMYTLRRALRAVSLQIQFGVNKALKLHLMREPPRRGQMARPRFVLSLEVLLYSYIPPGYSQLPGHAKIRRDEVAI